MPLYQRSGFQLEQRWLQWQPDGREHGGQQRAGQHPDMPRSARRTAPCAAIWP
jgi:hypothetical protein